MSGERCLNRDLGCLPVADFADEEHVRILAHDRAKRGGEGETGAFAHLHLHDTRQSVLDWVLDGDDVHSTLLQPTQGRVKRRRFSRPRRSCHEHESLAGLQQALDARQLVRREAD